MSFCRRVPDPPGPLRRGPALTKAARESGAWAFFLAEYPAALLVGFATFWWPVSNWPHWETCVLALLFALVFAYLTVDLLRAAGLDRIYYYSQGRPPWRTRTERLRLADGSWFKYEVPYRDESYYRPPRPVGPEDLMGGPQQRILTVPGNDK